MRSGSEFSLPLSTSHAGSGSREPDCLDPSPKSPLMGATGPGAGYLCLSLDEPFWEAGAPVSPRDSCPGAWQDQ